MSNSRTPRSKFSGCPWSSMIRRNRPGSRIRNARAKTANTTLSPAQAGTSTKKFVRRYSTNSSGCQSRGLRRSARQFHTRTRVARSDLFFCAEPWGTRASNVGLTDQTTRDLDGITAPLPNSRQYAGRDVKSLSRRSEQRERRRNFGIAAGGTARPHGNAGRCGFHPCTTECA